MPLAWRVGDIYLKTQSTFLFPSHDQALQHLSDYKIISKSQDQWSKTWPEFKI